MLCVHRRCATRSNAAVSQLATDGVSEAYRRVHRRCATRSYATVSELATDGVSEAYRKVQRSVVWVVKLADTHLYDLDRKIEQRIANRAKARAEGNYEAIAMEQNRLGELCIEHKARLDSMLFFWVLGGAMSVAGWARSAYGRKADTPSEGHEHLSRHVLDVGEVVRATIRSELTHQRRSRVLLDDSHRVPASPESAVSAEADVRSELNAVVFWQRCTFGVALAGCAVSIAASCKR